MYIKCPVSIYYWIVIPGIVGRKMDLISILLNLLSFSRIDYSKIWELTFVRSTATLPSFLLESYVPPPSVSYCKFVSELSIIWFGLWSLFCVCKWLGLKLLSLVTYAFCNFFWLFICCYEMSPDGIRILEFANVFLEVNSKFSLPPWLAAWLFGLVSMKSWLLPFMFFLPWLLSLASPGDFVSSWFCIDSGMISWSKSWFLLNR